MSQWLEAADRENWYCVRFEIAPYLGGIFKANGFDYAQCSGVKGVIDFLNNFCDKNYMIAPEQVAFLAKKSWIFPRRHCATCKCPDGDYTHVKKFFELCAAHNLWVYCSW